MNRKTTLEDYYNKGCTVSSNDDYYVNTYESTPAEHTKQSLPEKVLNFIKKNSFYKE